ncbi:hypothetical protein [Flavobacterium sp. LB1P71]|uniref:hypothetical protein n=1 Tax=unclassified Flavobacterium TaxID=196869 RepID=UPI003AB04A84
MRVQNSAIQTYKYFSSLDGNQHIASEFALKKVIKIIDRYKITNVLELGLGIGSIAYCVLDFSKEVNTKINYIGTESNEFCLEVLPKYLKDHFHKIQIFDNLINVISKEKFDLVIIDGKDENLLKIKNLMSNRGIVVIEGDRIPQLELIRNSFPNSLFTRLISNYKSPEYGPFSSSDWCG